MYLSEQLWYYMLIIYCWVFLFPIKLFVPQEKGLKTSLYLLNVAVSDTCGTLNKCLLYVATNGWVNVALYNQTEKNFSKF